jgi:hypothetical protein
MSMTWDQLRDRLHQALKTAPDFGHTEDELADILMASEDGLDDFDESAAIGLRAAIRYYGREEHWPDLSPEERTCLRYRLSISIDYATFLADAAKIPQLNVNQPDADEEDLLEWIVCDTWENNGYALMRDVIESYARGRYGEEEPGAEEGLEA